MQKLEDIQRQIDAIPDRYIFWTQKEIRALPEILDDDERIYGATSGILDKNTWLALATNKRIIFINCGMIYGVKQIQIPLDRVQSIDHEAGLLFGSIRVWDGASYFTLRLVLKSSISPFVRTVQEQMNAYKRSFQQKSSPSPAVPDVATQLEKLADLKERGVLTEQEFQEQKRKILG